MADLVKLIRTEKGDLPIDYTALANLPKSDTTLTKPGEFADAQVVGSKIKSINEEVKNLNTNSVKNTVTINDKPLTENIKLTPSDVGSAPAQHEHSTGNITSGVLPIERGGTNSGNGSEGLKNLLAAGPMILSDHQYGTQAQFDVLKSSGTATKGQIFFVKVQS